MFLCIFVMSLFLVGCGSSNKKQIPPNPPASNLPTSQSKDQTQNEELSKIKVKVAIDWTVKKDDMTKYVIEIQNTSDKKFTGKIHVIPSNAKITGSFEEEVSGLLPGEYKTIVSFVKIQPDTKFSYKVSGIFSEFKQDAAPGLNYEIINKLPGNGYMTFYIYTAKTDEETVIKICQDMKSKYAGELQIGFQIRFFDHKNVTEMKENFAAYALTKRLKISTLTFFTEEGTESKSVENI